MTSANLRSALEEAGVEVSDTDLEWMQEVRQRSSLGDGINQRELFIELSDQLRDQFDPSNIDSRLYKGDRHGRRFGELTLLGRAVVEPQDRALQDADAVIRAIKEMLEENPEKEEVCAGEISGACSIPVERISKLIRVLRDIGLTFGIRTRKNGGREVPCANIDSVGDAQAILEYGGIEQQIQKKIDRIGRIEKTREAKSDGDIIGDLGFGIDSRRGEPTIWDHLHPKVKEVARPRYEKGQPTDAVRAALRELEDTVKQKAGRIEELEDLYGASLMHRVFSPEDPILEVTDLDKGVREGYMKIFSGTMQAVRNPKAHKNITVQPERAVHFLFLVSTLFYKLEDARAD
jgi:uncharacterized protein (TIGR02391 family)